MADDDIREGDPDQPRKKKAPPPDDEDDDRPVKKRKIAKDEKDNDIGASPLSAVVPVGGSIWALLCLYVSLLSCVVPGLGFLSLLFGILAFVTHKHKASYGSITGNIRAILGIAISLFTIALWIFVGIAFLTNPRAFR